MKRHGQILIGPAQYAREVCSLQVDDSGWLAKLSRLPVRVLPELGESPFGYIERLLEANGYENLIDLIPWVKNDGTTAAARNRTFYEALAIRLEVDRSNLQKSFYHRPYIRRSNVYSFGQTFVRWRRISRLRKICPICFAQNGYSNSIWDLKLCWECPVHWVKLRTKCHCGSLLKWRPFSKCQCGMELGRLSCEASITSRRQFTMELSDTCLNGRGLFCADNFSLEDLFSLMDCIFENHHDSVRVRDPPYVSRYRITASDLNIVDANILFDVMCAGEDAFVSYLREQVPELGLHARMLIRMYVYCRNSELGDWLLRYLVRAPDILDRVWKISAGENALALAFKIYHEDLLTHKHEISNVELVLSRIIGSEKVSKSSLQSFLDEYLSGAVNL